MAVRLRTNITSYPGAIVEVENPFTCTLLPTIQELAFVLMGSENKPSVIVNGKIFTEATQGEITNRCEV